MFAGITRGLRGGLCGLFALWVAGCAAHALTASLNTESVSSAQAVRHAPDGAGEVAGQDAQAGCTAEEAKENCHRWTVLVGYPVEEAKQRARAAGFTGKIAVGNLEEHDAACKDGRVCGVSPKRWELNQGDDLTLWINRKVTITAPE